MSALSFLQPASGSEPCGRCPIASLGNLIPLNIREAYLIWKSVVGGQECTRPAEGHFLELWPWFRQSLRPLQPKRPRTKERALGWKGSAAAFAKLIQQEPRSGAGDGLVHRGRRKRVRARSGCSKIITGARLVDALHIGGRGPIKLRCFANPLVVHE